MTNEPEQDDLLPCPNCKSETAEIESNEYDGFEVDEFMVICETCGYRGTTQAGRADAIASWNKASDALREQDDRGFRRIDFRDANHDSCSVQESSSASRNLIWLGCDGNRMHLDGPTTAFLWPILKRFAETGSMRAEQDPRIACTRCKGSGYVLEGIKPNSTFRGFASHNVSVRPPEPSATPGVPSTRATPEDATSEPVGDVAEELEFLARAIEDVLATIDLEAERFGKLELHQKWGKTDWPRVASWLRERITARAGADEIRRLRARVDALEAENGALKDQVEKMGEELDECRAMDDDDDYEDDI